MAEIGYGTVCLTLECPVIEDWTDWDNALSIKEGLRAMKFNKEFPE